jgi:hypothetical protein
LLHEGDDVAYLVKGDFSYGYFPLRPFLVMQGSLETFSFRYLVSSIVRVSRKKPSPSLSWNLVQIPTLESAKFRSQMKRDSKTDVPKVVFDQLL